MASRPSANDDNRHLRRKSGSDEVVCGSHTATIGVSERTERSLARVLGPVHFFALSFGCIVGSGWVVVLGDWLRSCGPAGVVFGMIAGGSVLVATSGAYAELIARYPAAGGEFVFARHIFGDRTAFIVGWFETLSLLAVVAFEATALPWLLEALLPQLRGVTVYQSLHVPVTSDALVIGIIGTLVVATMNYRGVRAAARMQAVLSFTFLSLAVLIISLGFALGDHRNLEPLVSSDRSRPWWIGSLWIFAITPFFLNGFQSVAQTVEERNESVTFKRIARSMAFAILIAAIFYCLVTLAAANARPWRFLVDQPLATAAAFEKLLPDRSLSILVLVAATLSVIRVWNGAAIWAARLIMAQARASFLPAPLGAISARSGSPATAVIFVAVCNVLGVLAGKGAIEPLVDMGSVCLASVLVLNCIAALRIRKRTSHAEQRYRVPAGQLTIGYALAGSTVMAGFAFMDPILNRPASIPLEWVVIGIWGALGGVFWVGFASRRAHRSDGSGNGSRSQP